jgi:glycosyltransferase involved in cell wall biosynthesis
VPEHPRFAELAGPPATCRIDRVALTLTKEEQRAWLRGLDWLLFAEFPYLPHMVHQARELGINVACIPMWELTDLQVSWVQLVDLMICPTGYTRDVLGDWKRRFGFPWEVSCVPWPVDAQRLRFRRREKCRKFVFVNGTGGCRARRSDGSFTAYRRKGLELVLAAARMLPSIPFLVYSQADDLPALPGNVELRSPPASHERLYWDGDVCVQPSHWEGLGLQLLECQAAGLPLITTDAPPMNEFQPLRAVRAAATELVSILGNHVLTSHQPSAEDLAQTLESVYQTDVSQASQAARAFIEREHSWDGAKPRLLELLVR